MEIIVYIAPDYEKKTPGNCLDVKNFIGPVPPCPICNDYGEYEDDGPRGCDACNSRCLPLIDYSGKRVFADWGDILVKMKDGIHLIYMDNINNKDIRFDEELFFKKEPLNEHLLRSLIEVVQISDRDHDAWNLAKQVIAVATQVTGKQIDQ